MTAALALVERDREAMTVAAMAATGLSTFVTVVVAAQQDMQAMEVLAEVPQRRLAAAGLEAKVAPIAPAAEALAFMDKAPAGLRTDKVDLAAETLVFGAAGLTEVVQHTVLVTAHQELLGFCGALVDFVEPHHSHQPMSALDILTRSKNGTLYSS